MYYNTNLIDKEIPLILIPVPVVREDPDVGVARLPGESYGLLHAAAHQADPLAGTQSLLQVHRRQQDLLVREEPGHSANDGRNDF